MDEIILTVSNLSAIEITSCSLVFLLVSYFIFDKIITKESTKSAIVEVKEDLRGESFIEGSKSEEQKYQPKTTTAREAIKAALDFDALKNKEEALILLNESKSFITDPKDLVRINVVIRKYSSDSFTLLELVNGYLTNIVDDLIFTNNKSNQIKPKDNLTEETTPPVATSSSDFIVDSVATKDIPRKNEEDLAENNSSVTSEQQEVNTTEIQEETNKPIDLASQLLAVAAQPANLPQVQTPCHDVWANYMCFENGRMGLKNTFFNLNNAWGTVASIAELQDKIATEIGLDINGETKEWVMVSVIPFHANQQ